MSPRKKTPKRAKAERSGSEWVGGIGSMPGYMTGEGEPFRPDVLMWMADGLVLGSQSARPDEILSLASESFRETMARPMVGKAHMPSRVRVASLGLANVLRAEHPDLDIVIAPTPEVDHVLSSMAEHMSAQSAGEESYLSPDLGEAALEVFFESAAALFRAAPWNTLPTDAMLWSVRIPALGVVDAAVSVIGEGGESFGFIVFSTFDDYEAFAEAAEASQRGESSWLPPHFALNFERGAELGPELRKEIAHYDWEVAGPRAYPVLTVVDSDLVSRSPTAAEVATAEAVALGLVELIEDAELLERVWESEEPIRCVVMVDTFEGPMEVELRTPLFADENTREELHPAAILPALAELALGDDEIDHDLREGFEDQLLDLFIRSPEGRGLSTDFRGLPMVLEMAAVFLGHTLPTLSAPGLVRFSLR